MTHFFIIYDFILLMMSRQPCLLAICAQAQPYIYYDCLVYKLKLERVGKTNKNMPSFRRKVLSTIQLYDVGV